jgi:hypothetical protein
MFEEARQESGVFTVRVWVEDPGSNTTPAKLWMWRFPTLLFDFPQKDLPEGCLPGTMLSAEVPYEAIKQRDAKLVFFANLVITDNREETRTNYLRHSIEISNE